MKEMEIKETKEDIACLFVTLLKFTSFNKHDVSSKLHKDATETSSISMSMSMSRYEQKYELE